MRAKVKAAMWRVNDPPSTALSVVAMFLSPGVSPDRTTTCQQLRQLMRAILSVGLCLSEIDQQPWRVSGIRDGRQLALTETVYAL
jgi:hypothetical protein